MKRDRFLGRLLAKVDMPILPKHSRTQNDPGWGKPQIFYIQKYIDKPGRTSALSAS